MDDATFVENIREKIEESTGIDTVVELDSKSPWRMAVELDLGNARVILGDSVLKYPGFARMCVEYAVASIRAKRQLKPLEFSVHLQRN